MTPDGLSGLLMLVILWWWCHIAWWWCRQAWFTSRGIVEYRREELSMEACLALWPVYRRRAGYHSW